MTARTEEPRSTKRWIVAVAALVVGVALFFGGWLRAHLVGERQASAAQATLEASRAETAAAEAATAVASARVEALERNVRLLEARRMVAQALTDLDDRNFGSARTRTESAAALLHAAGGEMDTLATRLDALELLATEQLEEERQGLLEIARAFDQALPTESP